MEEILKIVLKLIIEEPALIVGNILKSMRSIFLFVISICLYKYYYGDFVLVKNTTELLDFFVSGFFLKPLTIFILAWLFFDLLLNICIEKIFSYLYIDKQSIKAKKEKELLNHAILVKQNKITSKEQLKRFYLFAIYRYCQKQKIIKNITIEKIKKYLTEFKKIEGIEIFNIISLVLTQLMVLLILINKVNIKIVLFLVIFLFLIQFFKSKIIYYKILLEDIIC